MTRKECERQWLTGEEPGEMVDLAIQPHPRVREYSERKFRLWSCACCRRIWHLMTFGTSREVVEHAERYADGMESFESMEEIAWHLEETSSLVPEDERRHRADFFAALAAFNAGWSDIRQCHGNMQGARYVDSHVWNAEYCEAGGARLSESDMWQLQGRAHRAMCDLLRDIFGNPFRKVKFDKKWRTHTAVSLARQMYGAREFSAMPILADALQDAGCDDDAILSHCRDTSLTHVRGCWVVDLVLGKQ